MQCKKHPRYKAIKKPFSTKKHPNGCEDCWKIFRLTPKKLSVEEMKQATEEAREFRKAMDKATENMEGLPTGYQQIILK